MDVGKVSALLQTAKIMQGGTSMTGKLNLTRESHLFKSFIIFPNVVQIDPIKFVILGRSDVNFAVDRSTAEMYLSNTRSNAVQSMQT